MYRYNCMIFSCFSPFFKVGFESGEGKNCAGEGINGLACVDVRSPNQLSQAGDSYFWFLDDVRSC